MSKRSGRRFDDELDFVPTPPAAVWPLAEHLAPGTRFYEPCAGDGALAREMVRLGHECVGMSDANPRAAGIERRMSSSLPEMDAIAVTNPPWRRELILPLMGDLLRSFPEVWLLQPLDHLANLWMGPMRPHHAAPIVMVGRVKWLEGSPYTGKENVAWLRYLREATGEPTTIRAKRRTPY